jgi:hypothetical protein
MTGQNREVRLSMGEFGEVKCIGEIRCGDQLRVFLHLGCVSEPCGVSKKSQVTCLPGILVCYIWVRPV